MRSVDLGDEPFPEADRLGVRVVDAEDGHAMLDPKHEHAIELGEEPHAIRGVEVDAAHVLVLVGRILCVTKASVGPVLEPVGVLGNPRMVGRTLDGEVESDLDAHARRGRDEVIEIVDRAELGGDGGVTAVGISDRPRATGIARLCGQRVVLALAVGHADGMHRREVRDVEPHLGELGQSPLGLAQRGALRRIASLGSREKLVPGSYVGLSAIGEDREQRFGDDRVLALIEKSHGFVHALLSEHIQRFSRQDRFGEPNGDLVENPAVLSGGSVPCFLEQQKPLSHIEGDVAIGFDLFLEVGEPGAEPIGPRFDGELVEGVFRSGNSPSKRSFPTCESVVSEKVSSPFLRHLTTARRAPCPSRKMSASTRQGSPTIPLAA